MDPIPAKDALATLLATEALLLAASTLAATIGHAPKTASRRTGAPAKTALAIACLMLVVSVAALAAWVELYFFAGGVDNPGAVFVAVGLLAPIVAIPVIGFLAERWAR